MTARQPPKGQLFSRLYLDSGKPGRDSARMRVRLTSFIGELNGDVRGLLAQAIKRELGTTVPTSYHGSDFVAFLKSAETRDVLDTVTLLFRVLVATRHERKAAEFVPFVERIFREENVGYSVDTHGGVHYSVDEEFERNRTSALRCLHDERYAAVAHAFDAAHSKLDSDPPDTKGAVRDVFEAVETLAKLIADSNSTLDAKFVQSKIKPIVSKRYGAIDGTTQGAAEQLLEQMIGWVNTVHKYRHGQNTQEPIAPPIELAILILSQGAGFLRWLVDLDQTAP